MSAMTTAEIARALGVETWRLLRAVRMGHIAEPRRLGQFRLFTEADLPRVRSGLVKAGYLPAEEGVHV